VDSLTLASPRTTARWSLIYLLRPQPSRDPLEGGLARLTSLRATARWPLFIYFPAIQSSSGGWTRSPWRVCMPRRVGLYVLRPQPSRDPLEGGLVHLASLRATARWPLFIYFPAIQSSSGGWDSLTLASLRATARWPFFLYFIPSLPEILWKVGSLAWRVCAPWHVGFYLLRSQPSRVPLEGGLACLVGLHVAMHWLCYEVLAFMYLFSLVSRMLEWYACSEVMLSSPIHWVPFY
jgi:hypothetical protein